MGAACGFSATLRVSAAAEGRQRDDAGERNLELPVRRTNLSARTHDRILKVARTVAEAAGRTYLRPAPEAPYSRSSGRD